MGRDDSSQAPGNRCQGCGVEVPLDARFCPGCGAPAAVAPAGPLEIPPTAETRLERRSPRLDGAGETAPGARGAGSSMRTPLQRPGVVQAAAQLPTVVEGAGDAGYAPAVDRDAPTVEGAGDAGHAPAVDRDAPTVEGAFTEVPSADALVGRTVLGQFKILGRMGRGGMGTVYLAEQVTVGRRAVIKVIASRLSADSKVAARFAVEAKAASKLSHPGIVTIYNYGAMEDGTLFIAMEYCRGEALGRRMRRGPLPPRQAVAIAVQICRALAVAHDAGVVHRDLKPSNVMLVQSGRRQDAVKVLDFGVARLEGVHITGARAAVGTPKYMSPEQCRGDEVDGRADLYALGVMLFEMLTGEPPFQASTPSGYTERHLVDEPPLGRLAATEASFELQRVVARALAKARKQRFASAEQMASALERAVSAPAVSAAAAERAVAAGQAPGGTQRWWPLVAGGLLAVVGLAVAGVVLLRRPGPALPPAVRRPAQSPAPSPVSHDAGARLVWIAQDARVAIDAGQRPAALARRAPARHRKRRARPAHRRRRGAAATRVAVAGAAQLGPPPAYLDAECRRLDRRMVGLLSTSKTSPTDRRRQLALCRRRYPEFTVEIANRSRKLCYQQTLSFLTDPNRHFRSWELRPIAELERLYLSMETKDPMPAQIRRQNLAQIRKLAVERNAPADRDFYYRIFLVRGLKLAAKNPRMLSRQ